MKIPANYLNDQGLATLLKGLSSGLKRQYYNKSEMDISLAQKTVSVREKASENTDYLRTYQVTQNGVPVGVDINIPKDFLVKSATSGISPADDVPIEGIHAGEPYLDFVINTKDGSGIDQHLYINVASLVDIYTSGSSPGDTIVIAINSNNQITASVTDGSITKAKLALGIQSSLALADSALQPAALNNYYTKAIIDQELDKVGHLSTGTITRDGNTITVDLTASGQPFYNTIAKNGNMFYIIAPEYNGESELIIKVRNEQGTVVEYSTQWGSTDAQAGDILRVVCNDLTSIPTSCTIYNLSDAYRLANSAYQKPTEGIPESDLVNTIRISLGKADTALQPSDIAEWAKSATKPSYNFSEINSKPTTIAGYGITNAYTKLETDNLLENTPDFVEEETSAAELEDEYATLRTDIYQALTDAQQVTDDATAAATLATQKAGLANGAATSANTAAGNANEKAALANTKAGYAQDQGDYAKQQGDYAKQQGQALAALDLVEFVEDNTDTNPFN